MEIRLSEITYDIQNDSYEMRYEADYSTKVGPRVTGRLTLTDEQFAPLHALIEKLKEAAKTE